MSGDPALMSTCARCGARFQCGVDEPEGCWCARLPVLPAGALDADTGCLCEACLRAIVDAQATRAAKPR
jgi:hypothetical protein